MGLEPVVIHLVERSIDRPFPRSPFLYRPNSLMRCHLICTSIVKEKRGRGRLSFDRTNVSFEFFVLVCRMQCEFVSEYACIAVSHDSKLPVRRKVGVCSRN